MPFASRAKRSEITLYGYRAMKPCTFILLSLALACQPSSNAPVPVLKVATTAEYAPYLSNGTASIAGQTFLLTEGGEAKRGAGSIVTADPFTPFAHSWALTEKWWIPPTDTLFVRARRTVTADADGRFDFGSLPAGSYLLSTTVTWKVSNGYGLLTQGGWIVDTVTVRDGQKRTVIMNHLYRGLGER